MNIPTLPTDLNKKAAFHRQAKTFLFELASELGLKDTQFEVRTNKGGTAVMGETTLHTDPIFNGKGLYIQLSRFGIGVVPKLALCRTVTSRKDYVGGRNNMLNLAEAVAFAKGIKNGTPFYQVR